MRECSPHLDGHGPAAPAAGAVDTVDAVGQRCYGIVDAGVTYTRPAKQRAQLVSGIMTARASACAEPRISVVAYRAIFTLENRPNQ